MKQWLLLFLLLFSLSVFAVDTDMNILKVSCWDTGKLELIVDSNGFIIDADTIEVKAIYKSEGEDEENVDAFYFPLVASDRYITSEENITLDSNEAVFNWSGMYRLSISYDKEGEMIKFPYMIGCPGLLFSCKASKLEVQECSSKDDKFEATVVVNGLEILEGVDQIENINFFMEATKTYEDINGETSTIGGLAKNFEIIEQDNNTYFISGEFKDNGVEIFTATFKYNDCELISEIGCDVEKTESSNLVTGAATTEVSGEMATELERKRQEVADIVQQNIEDYEEGGFGVVWIILIIGIVAILVTGMYILIKRKANKKPGFVKF